MVIVFARAPVAGRVKTRLAARLGPERAARLHERLTAAALTTALASRCGPVELHASARHAWLTMISRKMNVPIRLQKGADLGERMARAMREALHRAPYVLLTGTDCPEFSPRDFVRAARWLAGGADAVLAPALDGGYGMIALRRAADFLFAEMPWGSERVYAETARRLAAAGWRLRALGTVADIDRPEDLARLASLRFSSLARLRRANLSAV